MTAPAGSGAPRGARRGPIAGGRRAAACLLAALALLRAAGDGAAAVEERPERDRALRLRTVGRSEFLPDLVPPSGPAGGDTLFLPDGSELRWSAGAGMDRVDGFRPLLRVDLHNPGRLPRIGLYAAYGTASERWSGAGYLAFRIAEPLRVGLRCYDETTVFPDAVRPVSSEENFLAALLVREDFFDFLRRRGGALVVHGRPGAGLESQLVLAREDQRPRDRAGRRLGLFGGGKEFRPNPAVPQRSWDYLRLRQLWTTRPWSGAWEREDAHAALAEVVIGAPGPGGDATFRRFVLELRGRQRLTWSQFFAYRLRGGAGRTDGGLSEAAASDTTGDALRPDLPFAWRFRSGGIGTLRGHRFQEFSGDREFLGTLEYGLELPRQIRPILFLDTGRTWIGGEDHGGGVWGSGPWLVDGGVGLQLGAGPLSGRLDVARDLRAERSVARTSFRLGFPF